MLTDLQSALATPGEGLWARSSLASPVGGDHGQPWPVCLSELSCRTRPGQFAL